MKLKPALLKGVYSYGFEKPSAVQQRAIMPILKGKDVIAQSQSGTGKTTIFAIGILQIIDTSSNKVQAIVLSPTRELAEQTRNVESSSFPSIKAAHLRVFFLFLFAVRPTPAPFVPSSLGLSLHTGHARLWRTHESKNPRLHRRNLSK